MFPIAVIFLLAFCPSLIGLWLIQAYRRGFQERLTRIRERTRLEPISTDDSFAISFDIEESLSVIGDRTCFYNALSPYIRCAVNPSGPCESCARYVNRASRALTFLADYSSDHP